MYVARAAESRACKLVFRGQASLGFRGGGASARPRQPLYIGSAGLSRCLRSHLRGAKSVAPLGLPGGPLGYPPTGDSVT